MHNQLCGIPGAVKGVTIAGMSWTKDDAW